MKKRVFVTGATGFIGTNLVRELAKRRYQVCCLVRSKSKTAYLQQENVELVTGDLLSREALAEHVCKAEIVFHVAGVTRAETENDYFQGNLETTGTLVEAMKSKASSPQKLIYISSQAAGGACAEYEGINESIADSAPVSVYGQSKKKAEDKVLSLVDKLAVVVLRPSIVFGPHDRGMLPLFRAVARGIRVKSGWRRFPVSLVYIDDLVEAILLSAESKRADGKIFYVSDNRYYQWDELNEMIARHVNPKSISLPIPLPFIWLASRINGVLGKLSHSPMYLNPDKWHEIKQDGWVCDSSRIQTQLGFTPRWELDAAISKTAEWYRHEGLL